MLAPPILSWNPLTLAAAGLAAAVLVAAGCVKRQETIEVAPDASVRLTTVFEGDPDDIRQGDALLEEPGLWSLSDKIETDDKGNRTLQRTAKLTVPAGGTIPDRYCPPDAESATLATTFDTTIRTEQRPDGTHYYFERVYHPRTWAWIEHYRKTLVEDATKDLKDKGFADLTPEERLKLASALLAFETAKVQAFADAAVVEMRPPLPMEDRLAIRRAIAVAYDAIGPQRVVEILSMEDQDAVGELINARVAEVYASIERSITDLLDATDPTGQLAGDLLDRLEQQKSRFAITEDLQDESWEVTLKLPGRIVEHNGRQGDDGSIEWKFDGDALCDREVVLLATSVVERSSSAEPRP